jgi:ABC-type sugar transport system permease subunit
VVEVQPVAGVRQRRFATSARRPSPREQVRRSGGGINRREELLAGYMFIAPTAALLSLFYFVPLIETFYYSFTRWDPASITPAQFIGLKNYSLLTGQVGFLAAVLHTFVYLAFTVPISVAVGGGGRHQNQRPRPFRGRGIYRTLVFTPYIAPVVGSALVFSYILSPLGGVFNDLLNAFGVRSINFLAQNPWAMIWLIIFSVWQVAGFNMVIYLAALSSVPEVYYEASEMDGARWWARFRHITWPLIWPSTMFLLVIGVVNSIQVFTQVYALTRGGPIDSTWTVIYWIYQQDFVYFNGGLATAGSVVLFLIGMILTLLQLRFLGRRRVELLT